MKKNILLTQIWGLLERIDAALVTRDPGTARSAEAYDGLRKQLNQASKNRRMHVSHLLSLSDSIGRDVEYQLIKDRVSDFLLELGISRTSDFTNPDFFEIEGGEGPYLECIQPAVIETLDDGTVSLVRLGIARKSHVGSPAGGLNVASVAIEDEVPVTRGMKVAIGLSIAIVGFFFGWVLATNAQSNTQSSPVHEAPALNSQAK